MPRHRKCSVSQSSISEIVTNYACLRTGSNLLENKFGLVLFTSQRILVGNTHLGLQYNRYILAPVGEACNLHSRTDQSLTERNRLSNAPEQQKSIAVSSG
ncbi:hypothetical protein ElyMa_003903600 [Elysia marginata]|uniref:Uncharacterized protein n=1 Tax=Elysia marginata TaxID=1093978 RepID=A0AAV4FR57_9GAST|nr:hypothetical protein ElyMa_003903600 [Elysia marginata]